MGLDVTVVDINPDRLEEAVAINPIVKVWSHAHPLIRT